jgi:hypothetical protein
VRNCIACAADISGRLWQARLCWGCAKASYEDPLKLAAHKAVARARRAGLLGDPRTMPCADCGGAAVEYDHREYAQPLAVEPVCRRCNLRRGPAIDSRAWKTSPIKTRRLPEPEQKAAA